MTTAIGLKYGDIRRLTYQIKSGSQTYSNPEFSGIAQV